MKRKLAVVVATIGIFVGMNVPSAYAAPVTLDFNPAAVGCLFSAPPPCGTKQIDAIDLLPGNVLAVDVLPIAPFTPFQLYFQAVLSSVLLNTVPQYSPSIQSTGEITAVAGFREAVTGGTFPTATFSFVPGGNNFFQLYYDSSADANNLAGTGFNDGTLILDGTIIASSGNFTATNCTSTNTPTCPLDGSGANNYPGITTIGGNGSTRISVLVNYLDPTVFTNAGSVLGAGLVLTLNFDTTNSLPFISVNPSLRFWNGTSLFLHDIGTVNGVVNGSTTIPQDFQFQSDANGSFDLVTPSEVPEPATLSLLGLGLLGSVAAGRRHMKKKARQ